MELYNVMRGGEESWKTEEKIQERSERRGRCRGRAI